MLTPEQAAALLCPFARTFSVNPAPPGCHGPACMLWRWEKIMAGHPLWTKAVRDEAERLGEKAPFARAARAVADDPEAFGLVTTRGYCGAGGA